MAKIAEIKKDIEELEELQKQATRIKVKDILSIEIRRLISEVIKLEELQKKTESSAVTKPTAVVSPVTATNPNKCYEVTLKNYAWDQSSKYMKFYVTLKQVHTLKAENVQCTFTNKSLELKVKALENKDYVLKINKLLHDINPETSTWKVKADMVIVNLIKSQEKDWSHITETEKRLSDSKKLPETGKSDDPSEGIMSIMKNMYQQGDDEMKRTIAKAWSESKSKGPAF